MTSPFGNFSHPTQNIQAIGIGKGSTVVDLGAGSGFYAMAAARVVGPEGRVYAVDVQKELVDRIKTAAQSEHLSNLDVLWGDIEKIGGSKIGTDTADVVLVCNVLFQVEHKDDLVTEALRITRPNGRVCVIDWSSSHFGLGPDENLIVTSEAAQELFSKKFELEKEFNAGDHHYGLIFRKK